MTNAITEAQSIEQVVEIINKAKAGRSSDYFGGADLRSAEKMAGQHSLEAAQQSGYTDNDSIAAHLHLLAEDGANFDFHIALDNTNQEKKQ